VTSEQRTASRDEPRTPGEKMMAAYLDERSVPYRYESFGEGANPDFRADHPAAGEVMLEVYEPGYLLPRNPDGSYRSGAVAPPGRVVRRGLTSRRKSRQAAVARDLGIPFVLVVASTNAELAIGEHDIPGALFGSPEFQWSANADPDEPGRLVFGSGGRLQAHLSTRFSAVAVITRGAADTPAGRSAGNGQACRLQIFHNPFAAIPLKPEFASPYDDQWAAVDSGWKYQQIGPNRVLARPPRC
jgi:hypothetical protein